MSPLAEGGQFLLLNNGGDLIEEHRLAGVIERTQHACHVAQRRGLGAALGQRAVGLALEVEDRPATVGEQGLGQVHVAVDADRHPGAADPGEIAKLVTMGQDTPTRFKGALGVRKRVAWTGVISFLAFTVFGAIFQWSQTWQFWFGLSGGNA